MAFASLASLGGALSARDRVREMVPHFEHAEGWREMMTKWRGLMRSFNVATDRLAGIPAKRRKRRANPSTATSDS